MKLIIFDLDQTLVNVLEIHNKAIAKVFLEKFSVKAVLNDIDFAGKSLNQIIEELALLKNVPYEVIESSRSSLLENYESHFIQSFPADGTGYILQGAQKLLVELSRSDNMVVLYTGNSARIVDKILTATNLKKFFRFCLYGTEVKARTDMIKLAIERAEKIVHNQFRDKNIVVVGDSIRDIKCGKEFNALTISITTGFHTEGQLKKCTPDYIFPDMNDSGAILRAIG